MARLQINSNIGRRYIFVPGQLFVFGSFILHAGPTNHLGQVENFAPNQIVRFGNLEYTADSHGDLALSGWMPGWLENSSNTVALTSDLTPYLDIKSGLTSEPTSSSI